MTLSDHIRVPALMLLFTAPAFGAGPTSSLEEVTVFGTADGTNTYGTESVTQEDLRTFNRSTLDEAMTLVPGASVSTLGARNETNIWIRGFDRWRITLYQDGIPIYLPVDNRIDFSRFATADLSAVQVSRGFASVIDGPGAMGGSINLVSRVVTQPHEFEARVGTTLDSTGSVARWGTDVFAGMRVGSGFLQAAGSYTDQSHFRLADDFQAGTLQPAGDRLFSSNRDFKINLKGGWSTTGGSEYAVNVIDQQGRKDNPLPDGVVPAAALGRTRYWTWPSWDKQSVYLLGRTALSGDNYLKTRVYFDRFYNQLDSYDTISYSTQNLPKSFDSTYDDRAAGASAELGLNLRGGHDQLRIAGHFRWDEHTETQATRNAPGAPWYQQPWETALETTSSIAAEYRARLAGGWEIIAGTSADYRHLIGDSQFVASGVSPPYGYSFSYPVKDKHAWNAEFAVTRQYRPGGTVSVSYADRSRFPTLFEMYSTRFGTFVNNPDLLPERSHYGQINISDTVAGTHIAVSLFLARVTDAVTAVALSPTISENQNIGSERREGYEVELTRALAARLTAGLSYSHLARIVSAGSAVPTDTPDHKLFAWLNWSPASAWEVVASVDGEGQRWLQGATNNLLYLRGGNFTTLQLKVGYVPSGNLRFEIGARNATDQNYVVTDGYHAPGREYFANLRYKL